MMRSKTDAQRMKWTEAELAQAGVNATDVRYLEKFGLPVVDEQALKYEEGLKTSQFGDQRLVLFGELKLAGDIPLYFRQDQPGVWAIDHEIGQLGVMNSSAEGLARFLMLRQTYLLNLPQLIPIPFHQEFVSLVAKAMTAIDANAMAKGGFWLPYMQELQEYSADHCD